MRKIILSNMVTLDGYFEGPNQDIDWFVTNDEFFSYALQQLNEADTLLYGRITYQHMEAFWPTPAGQVLPAIAGKMNSLQKVVFSKTLSSVEWNNSVLAKGDIAEEVMKLKEGPGRDILIFGSSQIVSALTQLGLIDEYRLLVSPVILGRGGSMFKGIDSRVSLQLKETKVFATGVVVLHYVPVGEAG